jgi:hypothetical protein
MITIFLIILAGFFKSIMDTLAFHYEVSIFYKLFDSKYRSWFYIPVSSDNKYTWFPNSKILTWIISGPLVFITDAWHFFQMGFLCCISLAIALNFNIVSNYIIDFLIVHTIIVSTFQIFWRLFKIK